MRLHYRDTSSNGHLWAFELGPQHDDLYFNIPRLATHILPKFHCHSDLTGVLISHFWACPDLFWALTTRALPASSPIRSIMPPMLGFRLSWPSWNTLNFSDDDPALRTNTLRLLLVADT